MNSTDRQPCCKPRLTGVYATMVTLLVVVIVSNWQRHRSRSKRAAQTNPLHHQSRAKRLADAKRSLIMQQQRRRRVESQRTVRPVIDPTGKRQTDLGDAQSKHKTFLLYFRSSSGQSTLF
ncbi:hypothetical protein BV898_05187 [Hypsibius exemplaris]|uniref:Uncharacterized protein n=1 Tax=Hypsibius exemplaris TaxID=2072580 RepID=A0A1W0X044_HYPEX|nr:hypothetical protein BV898_05187 [Hypsibius exemplaris]